MWQPAKEIVELRFANEFLYWDKTGLIARKICKMIPTLRLENATPGQTNFVDDENQIRIRYGFNALNIAQDLDSAPTVKLHDHVGEIVETLIKEMEITTLTRVGHRVHLTRKFPTREKAEGFVVEVARKRSLGADLLSGADEWLKAKHLTGVSLRFDDEKVGIKLELSAGQSEITIGGPAAKQLKKHLPEKEYIALVDLDIYTMKPMLAEQFVVTAFRQSNLKLIKSRIEPIFEL
jgi:hypothetical protein